MRRSSMQRSNGHKSSMPADLEHVSRTFQMFGWTPAYPEYLRDNDLPSPRAHLKYLQSITAPTSFHQRQTTHLNYAHIRS